MAGVRSAPAGRGKPEEPAITRSRAQRSASMSEAAAVLDGGTGSLARGLRLLDALAAVPQPLGLADLAAAAGLEQSTALRLLRVLEDSRYVLRDNERKKYSLSPKAIRPLPLLHPLEQLRREIATPLRELALRVNKTVLLVLFLGTDRMVVDLAQGLNTMTAYYETWLTGPLHATGPGKAYLSGIGPGQRRDVLGPNPLPRFTPATLVTHEALDADLAVAVRRGYVVSREESRAGIGALAAPVLTWQRHPIGCLVATGPAGEFTEPGLEQFGDAMRLAADLILLQAPSLLPAAQFCGS